MMSKRRVLYLISFVAGCTSLGIEISAAHLLQTVYGTSNIVWAAVIATMLLLLALGYYFGGRWADRQYSIDSYLHLSMYAGTVTMVAGITGRWLLRPAAIAMAQIQAVPVVILFALTLLLLAVPVALLGGIAPYSVRLALDAGAARTRPAQTTGFIYAASTIGGVAGAIVTSLFILPSLGVSGTFIGLAILCLLAAIISGVRSISYVITIALAGYVLLAAEVAANRLLGPVFGDSNSLWVALIGVSMLSLAAGYSWGGKLADKRPSRSIITVLLVSGALYLAIAPEIAEWIMSKAIFLPLNNQVMLVAVATLASAVILGPIAFILACITPYVIRLRLPLSANVGSIAGVLYGVSTIGSLVGAYMPALWLVPSVGAARAMLLLGTFLSGVAAAFLIARKQLRIKSIAPFALIALVSFPLSLGRLKTTPGQIYETESAHNYIEVLDFDGVRYLLLNEGQGVHSIYIPDGGLTNGTWDYFAAAPFFNPSDINPYDMQRVAVIGLAAGTISKQLTSVYGPIPIDGIEIDPAIVRVGREFFDMNEPNLHVHIGDGRYEMQRLDHLYDLVAIDAYRLPYIPWHLTTSEFFEMVKTHMTNNGVLVINVGRTYTDRRLVEILTATLQLHFSSVHTMDVPSTFNSILVATVQPTSASNLINNLERVKGELIHEMITQAHQSLVTSKASDVIFSDDWAPVEQLSNQMVIDFVLSGAVDELDKEKEVQ